LFKSSNNTHTRAWHKLYWRMWKCPEIQTIESLVSITEGD